MKIKFFIYFISFSKENMFKTYILNINKNYCIKKDFKFIYEKIKNKKNKKNKKKLKNLFILNINLMYICIILHILTKKIFTKIIYKQKTDFLYQFIQNK